MQSSKEKGLLEGRHLKFEEVSAFFLTKFVFVCKCWWVCALGGSAQVFLWRKGVRVGASWQ